MGYDVQLIHGPAGSEGEMLDYIDDTNFSGTHVVVPYLKRDIQIINDLRALWHLIRLFKREKPAIVHTHTSKAGFLGRIAALLTGIPIRIHSMHGTIFQGLFSPWKSYLFIFLERFLGKKTHVLFTDTASVRNELINLGIGSPETVKVMMIGTELEGFRDLTSFQGRLKQHLNLPSDSHIIGCVARLVPIKGVQYLLKAIPKIGISDLHIVIAGDGELRKTLVEVARDLNILPQVHFLGFWKDLKEVYADIELLVVPSLYEGCPIAILEGMASGKPVIASKVGGIPDIIRQGENGILVPPKDSEELARAIHKILTNPSEGKRLGTNAQKEAFERFPIVRSVQETERIYTQLLS